MTTLTKKELKKRLIQYQYLEAVKDESFVSGIMETMERLETIDPESAQREQLSQLAICYDLIGDTPTAVVYWTKCAEQGDRSAMCNLGFAYNEQFSLKQAKQWFEKAAQQGCNSSILELKKIVIRENKWKQAFSELKQCRPVTKNKQDDDSGSNVGDNKKDSKDSKKEESSEHFQKKTVKATSAVDGHKRKKASEDDDDDLSAVKKRKKASEDNDDDLSAVKKQRAVDTQK